MNSPKLSFAFVLASCASTLVAQTGRIDGPTIGFVYDNSAGALRPVRGIPGASLLGDPVDAGFAMSSAVVAPRQDTAAATAGDGSWRLLRLSSGAVTAVLCSACPATAQAAIFSPSGTAVAFYSGGWVQVVTGLPDAPAAGARFEVGWPGRGASSRPHTPSMALSDDGAWLLAATPDSVELFSASGGRRRLAETRRDPLVAFAAASHDAVVADSGSATVALFHDVAGVSTEEPLATPDATFRPAAVAFSLDGAYVLLAVPSQQAVVSIEVASGKGAVTPCSCAPSTLVPMGSVFRLNEPAAGPLWLMDVTALPEPRIAFVPALPAN
jgi:hypothetical protein